jgi:curved DNA-binding protein CbpA
MSTNMDLNIDNYDLDDIFNLFGIPKNFVEEDVKAAKKIVLKTHPDKSGLHPDYFRFYSKAYKKLYFIWQFKSVSNKKTYDEVVIEYNDEEDSKTNLSEHKKGTLKDFLSINKIDKGEKFNKWFNDLFEKNKIHNDEETSGYGDWLKSNEDIDEDKKISYTQMGEEIEKKKQHVRSLVVHKGIDELYSNFSGASNLTGDSPECFSSDLFSSLQYEDLKKAHVESVIPVTMEDYNNVKKFNNLNEYNIYRNSQNNVPLSEIQAAEYLNNKNKQEEIQTTNRAYKLAKQLEETNKNQSNFWGSITKIKN